MLGWVWGLWCGGEAMGLHRRWQALREDMAAVCGHLGSQPVELVMIILWVLTIAAMVALHALEVLGDWTPVLIDPLMMLAAGMLLRQLRRARRSVSSRAAARAVRTA